MIGKWLVPAVTALLGSAAANATTMSATLTGTFGSTITRSIVSGAGAPQLGASIEVSRFTMDQTSGSLRLVGGPGVDFYAWCIEPRELINLGANVTYDIVPLSQSVTNIGGIGDAKALRVRELFGRFLPDFSAAITQTQAAALVVALWEFVRVTPGYAFDLATGNIFFTRTSNEAVFDLAASYVGALDGRGPLAQRLIGLNNGIAGVQGSGSQDLIVQAQVPEPASWAMLISGFGLVGAVARRRGRVAAA